MKTWREFILNAFAWVTVAVLMGAVMWFFGYWSWKIWKINHPGAPWWGFFLSK